MIADLVGWARMLGFAFLFGGTMFFDLFGGVDKFPDAIKDLHTWVQENKWQFGLMCFFLSSMV